MKGTPGEKNHNAVLNEAKVREIRAKYNQGYLSCNDLSIEYGVSATQIHRIVTGKTWAHVLLDAPAIRRPKGVHKRNPETTPKTKGGRVLPDMTPEARAKLEARFWAKVEKSEGCWIWTACRSKAGYGKFGIAGINPRDSHRVSYELANGPIPDGICVCHSCDNTSCVNPAHLFLGTQKENIRDMMAKGRGTVGEKSTARRMPEKLPRGAANVSTKLTEEQVRAIRALRVDGKPCILIARQFGISDATVRQIIDRKTWKHLD